jgi:septation ring formation regulator EzrA
MKRLTASLALLWALAPTAWTAGKLSELEFFEGEKKRLESLIRSTQDISTELESAATQLAALRAEYAKGLGPEEAGDRRRALRSRTQSLLERLAAVEGEFTIRKDAYETARTSFGAQSIISQKRIPPEMGAELLYIKKLVQFANRFAAVRLLVQEELAGEENAFEEARRSARNRAVWTWILLGLPGLAMAVGAWAFVRRKMQALAFP